MGAQAELSYVKFDTELDGREVFSGDTFAQKYSLTYSANNIYYRSQPRYYSLTLGYDLVSFDTKVTDLGEDLSIKKSFSKLRYAGELGYNGSELPVRFRAYLNNVTPYTTRINLTKVLIPDGLTYDFEGRSTNISSGVYFAFEPGLSRNDQLFRLPRLLIDYRESANKSSNVLYRVDNKTKELAVGALNKENNWFHYRTLSFENRLLPNDEFTQQQFQIGLVDNRGYRLWSALTNWISVSADGQFTNVKSRSLDLDGEEYDVNFMAVASRNTWNARTFLNYNRQLDYKSITDTTNVPIYLKGVYGNDTDWFLNLTAIRGKEQLVENNSRTDTMANNRIAAGMTMFKRASFTLSPSIELTSNKSYLGIDSYSMVARLTTASTGRYSANTGLSAALSLRQMDDGFNTARSKTWSSLLELGVTYRPNSTLTYRLSDNIEAGNGGGYLDANRLANGKVGSYLRNYLSAAAHWIPSSRLSFSLQGTSDFVKATDQPASNIITLHYLAKYDNRKSTYWFDSEYKSFDDGITSPTVTWVNSGEIRYLPDRYNDGLLRVSHQMVRGNLNDATDLRISQKYTYNIFAKSGVVRNVATLFEELSHISTSNLGIKASGSFLLLGGRYNPTERLSLYGSAKYEASKGDRIQQSVTLYYNAGIDANFKLLSASVDYSFAKRDIDKRVEKKLSATVRRTF